MFPFHQKYFVTKFKENKKNKDTGKSQPVKPQELNSKKH